MTDQEAENIIENYKKAIFKEADGGLAQDVQETSETEEEASNRKVMIA